MSVAERAFDLLSRLERREAALLSWGVVDAAFTEDEVYDEAEAFIETLDIPATETLDADDLIDRLIAEHLLWRLPNGDRFRTRMAEGIRLLFRLRQILHWQPDWRAAPNLVADYRLLLRPRSYPKRNAEPDEVRQRIESATPLSALDRAVVEALVHLPDGKSMRLADFQVDASRRVLAEVSGQRPMSGTIVCAGTGSGKTLAFYLPALLSLARWSDTNRWTRCLSLYPRNELLKDQLSSAVFQIRRINKVLRAHQRRPLVVGALFGDVPHGAKDNLGSWQPSKDGWICPYLSCPECREMSLVWSRHDKGRGNEQLRCGGCEAVVGPDLFALTRESVKRQPPDLLFTTLEMLNQRMSDPKLGPVFGVGHLPREQRPRIVLLDEVHTHEGVSGAQAALLLRRWKRASLASPHFVGLSATLADAQRFFADFTDLPLKQVAEISPGPDDLEPRSQEYMLAMRGDPISDTNLLSGSIQVAMLLRRLLDPNKVEGVHGTKVFGFTDDLDVTNRLYHDLLDAEGWQSGNRGPRAKGRNNINQDIEEPWLATYRAPARPAMAERFDAGQSWNLPADIGHRLMGMPPPVSVGRTSSQDTGVDAEADIVIATASLEVGYDDDQVGAVLQHKAPRNDAAFLQRKGRAGRRREMRPWTVVMLSAYGRDRIAYEGYEQLFSPQLQPRHLPLGNRHVLRIQATYTLMDWFAYKGVDAHIWQLLSGPPAPKFERWARPRIELIRRLIHDLLTDRRIQRELQAYLRQALHIDDETSRAVMWDPPRSLMMAVLPTLHRRLARRWACVTPTGRPPVSEPHTFWGPMPEFVPRNLFSDLNLPEVQIHLDSGAAQSGRDEDDGEPMPILQALREFVPGRVTLRFGISNRTDRHWIDPYHRDGRLPIEAICPPTSREELGRWWYDTDRGPVDVRVVRPFGLAVSPPPDDVLSSSNAEPIWHSQILPAADASCAALPRACSWAEVFQALEFYTHAHGNPLEVRRFTLGAECTVKRRGAGPEALSVRFVGETGSGRAPAALGFSMDVDGLRVSLRTVPDIHRLVRESDPPVLRGLRTARFAAMIEAHPGLSGVSNVFQRAWLTRVTLAALTLEAARERSDMRTLPQALEAVLGRNLQPVEEVLDTIFPALGDSGDSGRMQELRALVYHPLYRQAVEACAPCLWGPIDPSWDSWLERRVRATLAVGLREAAQNLCPELDAGALCVDIDGGLEHEGHSGDAAIWLTETTVGGGGFIEALFRAYTADPRRFFGLFDAALGPGPFEDVHHELSLLLGWIGEPNVRGEAIRAELKRAREADSHATLRETSAALRDLLAAHGLRTSHPVMTALHARVLRPGSTAGSDTLLARLDRDWRGLEEHLGIEIDAYVIAYLNSQDDALDHALGGQVATVLRDDIRQWRFGALHGLLWPRGNAVRAQALRAWNPYHALPETDRLLTLGFASRREVDIDIEDAFWRLLLEAALRRDGVASLSAPLARRADLGAALKRLQLDAIDLGYLFGRPGVRGVRQEGERIRVSLELAEVSQ